MIRTIAFSLAVSLITPWVAAETIKKRGDAKPVQASGVREENTLELAAYTAIDLRIPADMRVTIGDPEPLTIDADDNILPLIDITVKDGTLVISSEHEWEAKDSPDIEVTVAKLDSVSVTGAGDMRVTGLDNENLSVAAVGAADVRLSGRADVLSLSATGASDVEGFELVVKTANVSLIGASDANISVDGTLNVSIVGAGDLNYRGDARVTKKIVGAGDIKKVGAKKSRT